MAEIKDSFYFNSKIKDGDTLKFSVEIVRGDEVVATESNEKLVDGLPDDELKNLVASITIEV